ncbi:hypothetical protein F3U24_25535, partial [Salmonella enterica]|nr:hypothetical protein [Salmonella enterica]
ARSKKQPDMITPEEFSSASWRRAIYSLDDYEKAWILYCYGGKQTYMNHMLICEYIWLRMHERLRSLGKRITDDMMGNLIKLTGITAWNAGQLISGKDNAGVFAATYAAQEIGVKASAWSQNYKKHWQFMYNKCADLDYQALEKLMQKI